MGDSDTIYRYGWKCIKPGFLQIFNNIKFYLACITWAACILSFTVNGINNSNTTSYERRFGLTSAKVSWISSAYDLSAGIAVILITYLCRNLHKPRCVSSALVFQALGSFLMVLPHFTTDIYELGSRTITDNLCGEKNETSCATAGKVASLQNYLYVLVVGQLLHGISGATIYTIGVVFLDENIPNSNVPIYLGVFKMGTALGPLVGYVVGGQFLSLYVDFDSVDLKSLGLYPKDPRWVGAWWMGFVISGCATITAFLFVSGFPRRMPNYDEVQKYRMTTEDNMDSANSGFLDLMRSIWRLLRNKTFVCVAMSVALQGFGAGAMATFIPKIMQNQFHVTSGWAAMLTGMCAVPGILLGALVGGILPTKLKLKVPGLLKFTISTSFFTIALSAIFLIRCPIDKFVGVNTDYEGQLMEKAQLNSRCNQLCDCSTAKYEPICSPTTGYQYFTACYAGCSSGLQQGNKTKLFHSCLCVKQLHDKINISSPTPTHMKSGQCTKTCGKLYVFLVFIFFLVVFLFITGPSTTTIVLRSVSQNDRSLAMGMEAFIFRFLGSIPGPLVFGAVIDQTCIIWQHQCGQRGSCWVYDQDHMALVSILLIGICALLITVCLSLALLFYKSDDETTNKESQVEERPTEISFQEYDEKPEETAF